ncbi:hypothetical protein D0T12_13805 [Actinomadura spongiicola]|uniref:Uncharacterized protein n=1 Tax=Actinomadura spongiicola TaxID=2303421 RepID=A0A372GGY0_9ACTN|nr:hypothetical protein [Actinomadura spongiicola]RFS84620.1 hypothetical protein D0T12_13805 [Actinomadura spongiicola]
MAGAEVAQGRPDGRGGRLRAGRRTRCGGRAAPYFEFAGADFELEDEYVNTIAVNTARSTHRRQPVTLPTRRSRRRNLPGPTARGWTTAARSRWAPFTAPADDPYSESFALMLVAGGKALYSGFRYEDLFGPRARALMPLVEAGYLD